MGKLWRADNLYSFLHRTNLFLSEDDKFKHSSIGRSFHLSGIFPTLFQFPALFKFRKKLVTALTMKMGCRCRSGNKTLPVRGPRACSNRAWGPSAGHQGQERLECPSQLLTSCTLKPSPAWFGLLLYFSSWFAHRKLVLLLKWSPKPSDLTLQVW